MATSNSLRGFRKEDEKEKGQTLSMLRFVRQPQSARHIGSSEKAEENTFSTLKNSCDSSSSSSSPNCLTQEPSLSQCSKLFFVKPLSDEERNEAKSRKDSGLDMSSILNSHSSTENGSANFSHTENEHFGTSNHVSKRLRIESDDEDGLVGETVSKKPCLGLSDDSPSPEAVTTEIDQNKPKHSAEMIEKLLDTYRELYPHVDRMELFETMERWNYNFAEMTKSLDVLERERKKAKTANNAVSPEEKRKARQAERVTQRKKKAEEVKRKKIIWKMKARVHSREANEESDEDDYIGNTKVYESDSSENEDEEDDETVEEAVAPARNMVLEFYNESSQLELSSLPGCSKKKADVIMGCRPFENWRDLVSKFKTGRHLSTDLLNNAKDVLQMRNAIKNLMKKCERISSEIKNFVNDIINDESDAGMRQQPQLLNPEMQLKNYQLVGLNWLAMMHEQQLNAVLADEMGLGKTVQAIAFLAHLKERGELEERLCLIVVPSSTLDNWARELSLWAPSLTFLTYHGSQEERKGMRIGILSDELEEDIHIVLTTYSMLTSQEDKILFKRLFLHTVIFDEAHMLKNMTSQRYENLMKIKCKRRLLLTGTPLQNNLLELISILVFVMPQLFEGRKEELKKVFSMFPKNDSNGESRGRYERERILQAKRIMAPFFLRRLKADVLKDLPKKTDEILYVSMGEKQELMYKNTVQVLSKRAEEIKEELEKIKLQDLEEVEELQEAAKAVSKSKSKIEPSENSSSNMLMKLRKIANHPLLVRNLYTDEKIKEMSKILKKSTHKDSILDYIIEDFGVMTDFEIHKTCQSLKPISEYALAPDMIVNSGKMEKLDEMLPQMKEAGDRVLIFSQFVIVLNLLEEYMKIRGYTYRRLDGSTQVADRQDMIDDYNEDDSIFVFLLSTRAGGLGINLCTANRVILHDIDFNPYNDKQAEDRCHRVGQLRDVKVYRFICKNSIEEGMHEIAKDKLRLEKDVTGTDENEDYRKSVAALLKTALRVDNPE